MRLCKWSFFLLLGMSLRASAEAVSAIVASIDGKALILNRVSTQGDDQKSLIYEGIRYYFSPAKIGMKLVSGQGVMTTSDGKVKVIYQHGDVVIVGPSSSLFVPIPDGKTVSKNEINLLYGKVRAVIDSAGPLSGVKIKTPTAVAGVRGTDLFVSYNYSQKSTEVQVLRGEVEVAAKATVPSNVVENTIESPESLKPIQVKSGEFTRVELTQPNSVSNSGPSVLEQPVVQKSTKQDIAKIQNQSIFTGKSSGVTSPVQNEVNLAEKRAVENIVRDIQRYDPEGSRKIAANQFSTVDEINRAVGEKAQQNAAEPKNIAREPEAPKYVFDGPTNGFMVAGIQSIADCSNMGYNGGSSCSANQASGGQIGLVHRKHRSERFVLEYAFLLDDRNVSINVNSNNIGQNYSSQIVATGILLEGSFLATYNFGTRFSVEGGLILGAAIAQYYNNNNSNWSSGNGGGVFSPLQVGIRYGFSKSFDAELLFEGSAAFFGDAKINGLRSNSTIFRGTYFFF